MTSTIRWEGKQAFYIAGTEHDEDTIRVVASQRDTEEYLQLILPTLCITYADLEFVNDIGGEQADYPDSAVYGPRYFDPPVVIDGQAAIEKFTWIRGAERVTIGPKETMIEWHSWRTLVIPRLRIKTKEKAQALLSVPEVPVTVSQPFIAKAMQYADGRHVGGAQLVKRHPDWKPEPVPQEYDLWLRAIDGHSRSAIPEAKVSLFTWEGGERPDEGKFVLEAYWHTNGMGIVDVTGLPCSDKKLVIIECTPWLPRTWRFRPLPGQEVKRTLRFWQNKRTSCSYVWTAQDTIEAIAILGGSDPQTILDMNKLDSAGDIKPGQTIEIPCFEAVYRVEARDTLERLSEWFCYDSAEELAEANRLIKPYKLYQNQELRLPGWCFFLARPGDLFEELDEKFGLPGGSTRPAQRTLHDDPTRTYENEVVAVPTPEFVRGHEPRRWY
jgi:LysM repeat protein